MHYATIVEMDDGVVRRLTRSLRYPALVAILFPGYWVIRRLTDPGARATAKELGGALLHLGMRLLIHTPHATYSVPWREVEVRRKEFGWRLQVSGMTLSLPDDHLSARDRRRLDSSTDSTSP